jgi:hypothetical protein
VEGPEGNCTHFLGTESPRSLENPATFAFPTALRSIKFKRKMSVTCGRMMKSSLRRRRFSATGSTAAPNSVI